MVEGKIRFEMFIGNSSIYINAVLIVLFALDFFYHTNTIGICERYLKEELLKTERFSLSYLD